MHEFMLLFQFVSTEGFMQNKLLTKETTGWKPNNWKLFKKFAYL